MRKVFDGIKSEKVLRLLAKRKELELRYVRVEST